MCPGHNRVQEERSSIPGTWKERRKINKRRSCSARIWPVLGSKWLGKISYSLLLTFFMEYVQKIMSAGFVAEEPGYCFLLAMDWTRTWWLTSFILLMSSCRFAWGIFGVRFLQLQSNKWFFFLVHKNVFVKAFVSDQTQNTEISLICGDQNKMCEVERFVVASSVQSAAPTVIIQQVHHLSAPNSSKYWKPLIAFVFFALLENGCFYVRNFHVL